MRQQRLRFDSACRLGDEGPVDLDDVWTGRSEKADRAVSRAHVIQRSGIPAPAATGGKAPVSMDTTLSYGADVESTLTVAPFESSDKAGNKVNCSGMTLLVGGNKDSHRQILSGKIGQLQASLASDAKHARGSFAVKGLSLDMDLKPAVGNLLAGTVDLTVDQIDVTPVDAQAFSLSKLSEKVDSGMAGGNYYLHELGLAKAEGGNLLMTVSVADKKVNFNGKDMPMDQFAETLAGFVPSGLTGA